MKTEPKPKILISNRYCCNNLTVRFKNSKQKTKSLQRSLTLDKKATIWLKKMLRLYFGKGDSTVWVLFMAETMLSLESSKKSNTKMSIKESLLIKNLK